LERRLPPGNVLDSLILGGAELALPIDGIQVDDTTPVLRRKEASVPALAIVPSHEVSKTSSDVAGVHEPVDRPEHRPVESAFTPATAAPTTGHSRVTPQASAAMPTQPQFGGLAAPIHRVASGGMLGTVRLGSPPPMASPAGTGMQSAKTPTEAKESEILDNYGKLPLSFEQNVGQIDDRVDFVSRAGGSTLFLTPTTAIFAIQNPESRIQISEIEASVDVSARRGPADHLGLTPRRSPTGMSGVALHMQIVGGNPDARPTASQKLPGITNYFIGNDPDKWHTNIASFGRVEYDEVYQGIDLAYYANNGHLEYDFIVSPGADPDAIALNFAGADDVQISPQGDLVVHTAAGDIVQQKPFTYQESGNTRLEIPSSFVIESGAVRFQIGDYDQLKPVIIDPVMNFETSTFLGGASIDEGRGIAVDAAGNAYITGITHSSNFPVTPGAFDTTHEGWWSGFVTKFNPTGSSLIYSTILGASLYDDGIHAIAVDGAGNAYVTGATLGDIPTTAGAFDTTFNGSAAADWGDAFVTKLNPAGNNLVYSTYLGGAADDLAHGIAVDNAGNAHVIGVTQSVNFPTTTGAMDESFNGPFDSDLIGDAFVTKLNSSGSAASYSTFLGGVSSDMGSGIALDVSGSAYVTGWTTSSNFPTTPGAFDSTVSYIDAFVTKISPSGTLVYSTFLGGNDIENDPFASEFHPVGAIAVDAGGNAYVTGNTDSLNFPITPGAFDTTPNGDADVFLTKLNATGSALIFSTFLGGAGFDVGYGLALDSSGNAYITGETGSLAFPTKPGAFDSNFGGPTDAFVSKINASGSVLAYSTFLGGVNVDSGHAIDLDAAGNVYVTGFTSSSNFPTTSNAFDSTFNGNSDVFVTRFWKPPLACGCFVPHTISTAAQWAVSVFTADVDSDGDTDVLSASLQDHEIAWYENNGSENFTAHTITNLAFGARSVFAADVDGDGDTDVLSASYFDDKIAWYENNGSETFTARTITTSADHAYSVFATDVDGDGDTDVLSASYYDDKIAWYENNGSEVFTARTITTAANGAQSVFATDVDGDGDIDVLSASYRDSKIAWYENNGSETFTAHTISTAAIEARSVFAADVDSDGDTDVLSASSYDDKIAWYENNGSEVFTARTITTAANGAMSVYATDIDNDDDVDVLSASFLDSKIAWYENNGSESFTAHSIATGAASSAAMSVFAADVDGDDFIDVVSASLGNNKIAWYENGSTIVPTGGMQTQQPNSTVRPFP
jgi:hypothetical protein